MLKLRAAIVLIVFLFLAKASITFAEFDNQPNAMALSLAPAINEVVLTPGESKSQVFQLTNGSKMPLPIKGYVRSFDASDEIGDVSIQDEPDTRRLAVGSWISVDESDFILQPGRTREVTVHFNPPPDLPPGGYYGILFFEPLLPEYYLSESSVNVGSRIGGLLFMIAGGEIWQSGQIESFDSPRYHFKSLPADFSIRFKNSSNVHLRPSGSIKITNLLTGRSHQLEVKGMTVLPGKVRQQIINDNRFPWPGLYKAEIEIIYGSETKKVHKDLIFYSFPLTFLGGALIMLLVMAFVLSAEGRSRLRRFAGVLFGG